MSKLAYYVRVSTRDKQDYKYQIDTLDRHLKGRGVKINPKQIDVFSEKESGYNSERPELNRLINIIQENPKAYSCIYVTEISRLGRSTKKVREVLEILKEAKVNLYVKQLDVNLLNDDGSINSYGNLMLSIFIELSDAEARTAKERFKNGIYSAIVDGKTGGGRMLPYGFRKGTNKKLEIDEEEAETVRLIFDLYKAGYGLKAIAGELNNRNTPTRANKSFSESLINKKTGKYGKDVIWQDKTVDDILKNPIYIGKRRYWGGKQNHKNEPTLIEMQGDTILQPTSIFDECMEIRNSKTHRNYLTSYVYLLKDKLICGVCGRNYFAKYKPVPQGDKVYICSSRLKKNGNCGNGGVNISLIESAIFNEIVNSDSILRYINNNSTVKKTLKADIEKLKSKINSLNNELVKLDKDIDKLIELQLLANDKNDQILASKYQSKIDAKSIALLNNKNQFLKAETLLIKTENALKRNSNLETTSQQLVKFKKDRSQLRSVFLQVIEKIIIYQINSDVILADVFISIDGIVLPNQLRMFLSIDGIRKKEKQYRYVANSDFGIQLTYENNILKTKKSYLNQVVHTIKENQGLIESVESITIPDKNILTIPVNNNS